MNRIRLAIHRLFRRPAITGPMRLYTRRVPDGVFLDLEDYFTYVIETLVDDEDAFALLLEIAEDRSMVREHDGWEPEGLLMERLAERIGHEIPVRGKSLGRLGKRMLSAVPKPKSVAGTVVQLPGQRQAGAA